ncbi:MAG: hypothetical protein Kow0098_28450 [Ignavibacteriaceae bacterium]
MKEKPSAVIVCSNCGAENPFYALNCSGCKSFFRERVPNIDFGKINSQLIEAPSKAFTRIIYAEHKNFVFLILILIAVKFFINLHFSALLFKETASTAINEFLILIISLATVSLFFYISSLKIRFLNRLLNFRSRIKDSFAVITFSFYPLCFVVIILFPIELIVFGEYLFSVNPSPFELKEMLAYILLAFEALPVLWSLFLLQRGLYVQSKNIFLSVSGTVIIQAAFYGLIVLLSYFLFR